MMNTKLVREMIFGDRFLYMSVKEIGELMGKRSDEEHYKVWKKMHDAPTWTIAEIERAYAQL